MEQYNVDKKLYKWMKKTIYKRHPKWNKRRWVRNILYAVNIFVFIVAINIAYNSPTLNDDIRMLHEITGDYTFIDYFSTTIFLVMGMNFIPMAIALSYRAFLYNTCRGSIGSHRENTLILTEEALCNIFHIAGSEPETKVMVEFRYEDIRKIVWNEYFQRYEINGISIDTYYSDYEEGKVRSKNRSKGNLKEPFHLSWVFEDREKFSNSIEERTRLKIINT